MPVPIRSIQVVGGSEFAAFEQACQQQGIRLFVLSPRSPKLNGAVDARTARTRKNFMSSTPASWIYPLCAARNGSGNTPLTTFDLTMPSAIYHPPSSSLIMPLIARRLICHDPIQQLAPLTTVLYDVTNFMRLGLLKSCCVYGGLSTQYTL
jgi:hypothetical protein